MMGMGRESIAKRRTGSDPGSWRAPRRTCLSLAFLVIALAAGFGAGRANAGGRSIPGGRALVLAMAAQAAPQTQPAIADAAHLEDGSDRATLTFDLSHPVDADAFVLAKPNRVVIDLPAVDFQLNPQIGSGPTKPRPGRHAQKPVDTPAAGLIASYRFGLFAPASRGSSSI